MPTGAFWSLIAFLFLLKAFAWLYIQRSKQREKERVAKILSKR